MLFERNKKEKTNINNDTPSSEDNPQQPANPISKTDQKPKEETKEKSDEAPHRRSPKFLSGDWMKNVVKEHDEKGGFEHLSGKGKPLKIEGDILNNILKNANALPQWIELQHEIRDELKKLANSLSMLNEKDIEEQIVKINKKISQYNFMVPSSSLQKNRINRDTIKEQIELWS